MLSIWNVFVWVLFHCYTPAGKLLVLTKNKIQMQVAEMGFLRREARLPLLDRLLPPVPPWAWPAGRKPQGRSRKLKRDLISLYAREAPGDPPPRRSWGQLPWKRTVLLRSPCRRHRSESGSRFQAASFFSVHSIVEACWRFSINNPTLMNFQTKKKEIKHRG